MWVILTPFLINKRKKDEGDKATGLTTLPTQWRDHLNRDKMLTVPAGSCLPLGPPGVFEPGLPLNNPRSTIWANREAVNSAECGQIPLPIEDQRGTIISCRDCAIAGVKYFHSLLLAGEIPGNVILTKGWGSLKSLSQVKRWRHWNKTKHSMSLNSE